MPTGDTDTLDVWHSSAVSVHVLLHGNTVVVQTIFRAGFARLNDSIDPCSAVQFDIVVPRETISSRPTDTVRSGRAKARVGTQFIRVF